MTFRTDTQEEMKPHVFKTSDGERYLTIFPNGSYKIDDSHTLVRAHNKAMDELAGTRPSEERERELEAALGELVLCKTYKDKFGKDEYYEIAKEAAWDRARQALKEKDDD